MRKEIGIMVNWKKIATVGVVIGAGAYAFSKFIVPKLSVVCVHSKEDDAEEKDFVGNDAENTECDCDNCECGDMCSVHVRAVPLSELPDGVKDAIGALAGAVGFDVKLANEESVPQPHGEYVPNRYDLD